jgi:hypothetical protein
MNPKSVATVTITGVTTGISQQTSIAYSITGTFTASPLTLAVFQAFLTSGALVRTGYRGTAGAEPDPRVAAFDAAGLSSGELTLQQ